MNTLYKILFAGFILLISYPSVYAQDDVLNKILQTNFEVW